MAKQTALYLISGFLGSGKTTLVKRLLETDAEAKIGVVINEFGKISIDGPIIKRPNLEMIEVNRGSIFCSCLKMTFTQALIEMAGKGLDYVIVESSGLADPSNIEEILRSVSDQVANPYCYSGSITVVDANQFFSQIEAVDTLAKQIECADLTWINKVDLVDQDTVEKIEREIRQINPHTELRSSAYFKGMLEILGKDLARGRFPALKASSNTPENKPKTMSLNYSGEIKKTELETFIGSVMASAYRVKGFVCADQQWWEVHGVGDRIDFYRTERHFESSTLVVISKIGPNIIRIVDSAWKNHIGIPMQLING